jgi:quercetin dioxygenase-like cupin family protein
MRKSGKFWGETSPIFNKNNVEIHRLEGNPGGYSSKHKHHAKYNMFLVEDGNIEITTWKDPSGQPDVTYLEAGDTCVVPPGLFHKFTVISQCIVYEIYWVELREDDIEREDSGGIIKR